MGMPSRLRNIMSRPGANYFFLGGVWGIAAIPCLCPACLAGPAAVIGRGAYEIFRPGPKK